MYGRRTNLSKGDTTITESIYRHQNKDEREVFVIASRGCGKSYYADVEIKQAIKEGKKVVII